MAFLITKELIFGFQILDLKDHFSASLKHSFNFEPLPPLISGLNPKFDHASLCVLNRSLVSQNFVLKSYLYQTLSRKTFFGDGRLDPPPPLSSGRVKNYCLLTGCKGRTRKYKPKDFHTARACEGCLEN